MKKFVIGDIHGNIKALKQCLERSKFDYKKDLLIQLGDIVDGWPFVNECFDELLKIKNRVDIIGNHDRWALDWFDREITKYGSHQSPENIWYSQGGKATLQSYGSMDSYDLLEYPLRAVMPKSHLDLLKNAKLYHKIDNMVFTHGGVPGAEPLSSRSEHFYTWDRDMLEKAVMVHPVNPSFKIGKYDKIFIGHTSTEYLNKKIGNSDLTAPIFACNVIDVDTGAGWSGKLTIMNIDSLEYFQSELASELYPNIKGRR